MKLYILKMPFKNDTGETKICSDCSILIGALSIYPRWSECIEIIQIDFSRPRLDLLKKEPSITSDWLPLLKDGDTELRDPIEIIKFLSVNFGGPSVN